MHNAKVWRDGSIVFLGICLLVLDTLGSIQKFFKNYIVGFDESLEEIRDRRAEERERRSGRRITSVTQKPNLREFLKIPETKESEWANESIDLAKALSSYSKQRDILVAVIDTGIDYTNPKIRKFLFQNQGELGLDANGNDRSKNGIDDDMNGYVDDVFGWDFADKDSYPEDTNGHGTHIAGIIIDELDPDLHGIRVLPLKFYKESNTTEQSIENTANAIRYAVDQGAKIINYSAGGYAHSDVEEDAIEYAKANGVLVIAAAGNHASDNDRRPYYPASYNQANLISVGSLNKQVRKVASSNYGRNNIDIFAPGKEILGLGLAGKTKRLTGTSQATAFVSKIAALLAGNQILTPNYNDIKNAILAGSKDVEKLKPYAKNAKALNAFGALSATTTTAGGRP